MRGLESLGLAGADCQPSHVSVALTCEMGQTMCAKGCGSQQDQWQLSKEGLEGLSLGLSRLGLAFLTPYVGGARLPCRPASV